MRRVDGLVRADGGTVVGGEGGGGDGADLAFQSAQEVDHDGEQQRLQHRAQRTARKRGRTLRGDAQGGELVGQMGGVQVHGGIYN
jgi:hypothetical protein